MPVHRRSTTGLTAVGKTLPASVDRPSVRRTSLDRVQRPRARSCRRRIVLKFVRCLPMSADSETRDEACRSSLTSSACHCPADERTNRSGARSGGKTQRSSVPLPRRRFLPLIAGVPHDCMLRIANRSEGDPLGKGTLYNAPMEQSYSCLRVRRVHRGPCSSGRDASSHRSLLFSHQLVKGDHCIEPLSPTVVAFHACATPAMSLAWQEIPTSPLLDHMSPRVFIRQIEAPPTICLRLPPKK
ncbi:hypothetical protein AWB74_05765 [Caballeronia arvi]|uniref:Uncharacterized protein n=1 Tax=Caballeronia arvi TaxID=1777135 RepID=A0A158KHR9_9BURK|nr:hypothetical protein AWB74_05765 [Caballeronia arvi]